MFGKSFDRVTKRFRQCINDLEVVEVKAIDQADSNEKVIEGLIDENRSLQEEKRRASRMRTKLQEIVGD